MKAFFRRNTKWVFIYLAIMLFSQWTMPTFF